MVKRMRERVRGKRETGRLIEGESLKQSQAERAGRREGGKDTD